MFAIERCPGMANFNPHLDFAFFVISKNDFCPGFCTVWLHAQQEVVLDVQDVKGAAKMQ